MADLADRLAKLSPEQRALLEKRLAEKKQAPEAPRGEAEPIAVVGMACRFAGAKDLDAYWRMIRDGVEGVTEVPADRWPVDDFYDAGGAAGTTITRRGGFLDAIGDFDPTFFGVTPREAARMDPQQRVLLEVAWEALEHGGQPADRLAGANAGVYVGIGGADYAKVPAREADYYQRIDAHMGVGNALSIAANRISYALDFRGPSLAVDTACSSSSLAIHLAATALRRGECDAALAGGVNAILTPETTIAFSKAQMLSPDGRCRPFDAGANGYVRGEGCGLVVLKRLADAERDDDRILAVLRGTAVNQDGRTSGISAPNGERQKACIRAALAEAGLTPRDVDYVEAHGTSTPLGDPIEMQALCEVFRRSDEADPPVRVTSVKANIGHTETVSGVAGLIKVALLLRHGVVAPQLHLEELNPHIRLDGSRIQVPREAGDWKPGERLRVAGVSSFGFGGANTHLVVSEPPPQKSAPPATVERDRSTQVVKLSARTEQALAAQASRLADWLDNEPAAPLSDVAFTANTGRCDFNHRAAVVADAAASAIERLRKIADGGAAPGVHLGKASGLQRPKTAWMFTGQGAQRAGMGRGLYESQPVFRAAVDRVAAALDGVLEDPLLEILYPADESDDRVNETRYTQPALFAVEHALAELWRSWGSTPDALLGHSIGEYAAAVAAGVMGPEEAALLVAERARLMHSAPGSGAMAVLFAPEARVREALVGREAALAIAAVNGPENTVISGESDAVEELFAAFEAVGVKGQRLVVSHGFHSPLMDPVLDDFERFAERFEYHPPSVPIASNVSGELIPAGGEVYSPRYWRDHLRGAVRFADGVAAVAALGVTHWIEAGPAPVLLGMARRCDPRIAVSNGHPAKPLWLPSLRSGKPDDEVIADSVAASWADGATLDWRGWDRVGPQSGRQRRLVDLPTYPFQRERYWYEGITSDDNRAAPVTIASGGDAAPVLGERLPVVGSNEVHEVGLGPESPAYLADHRVQGSIVAPGALYIEQALAATAEQRDDDSTPLRVDDVGIQQAMFLVEGQRRRVQTTLAPESAGRRTFEVYSLAADADAGDAWPMHATAQLVRDDAVETPSPIDLDACRGRKVDTQSREEFYATLATRGLEYGPAFQMLSGVERSAHDAVATVDPSDAVRAELGRYRLHPVLGDALMQAVACSTPLEADGSYSPHTYVPVRVASVRLLEAVPGDEPLFAYAARRSPTPESDETSPETVESDAYLTTADGRMIAAFLGVRVQRLGAAGGAGDDAADPSEWLYATQWRETPLAEAPDTPGGAWLIFADDGGVADRLVERVEQHGGSCVVVRPADEFSISVIERSGGARTEATIDPASTEHYDRLLQVVAATPQGSLAAVAHLWSTDLVDPDVPGAWEEAARLGAGSVMRLMQQAVRRGVAAAAGLCVVTRGAEAPNESEPASPTQAATIGLTRTAAMEHPELHVRAVDLDPNAADSSDGLIAELAAAAAGDDESEIALRGGRRFVARLEPDDDARFAIAGDAGRMAVPKGRPHQLRIHRAGSFEGLRYEPIERATLEPGQVEIAVHATGLNFSDVLKALGLYPGIKDAIVPLGIEASGVVTGVGEGVDHLRPGDEAVGVLPYAFGSHATTNAYAMVKKPAGLSHDEAATIPITFLTAHHALVRLAQLAKGERVLIHAGAGGVGLAAIQIAQHVGAEVFTTAGSDEKRELLRSLGVKHVMNSRTLDFVDEVREATGREGVDVVLNSLPGEAIPASLGLLRAYGRFCEIGKIDIYQDRKIGLLPFQDNLSYFAIDLDRVLRERPEYVRGLFADVMRRFEQGAYRPLPLTTFPLEETAAAFRYMSQRKNIGKVVVSAAGGAVEKAGASEGRGAIHSDGGYLITGGLGTLGRRVAAWLAERGAGGVALLSRRAPSDEVRRELDALREAGPAVACLAGDVTDADSLRTALATLPSDFPPIRGVIHAAGVLDDGLLRDLDAERLSRVLRPKTVGAWNLHRATLDPSGPFRDVDLFVLFSSFAAVLGSPGQANYAAANAALDALAHTRRAAGLAATTINWGPFAGGGMAAGDVEEVVRQRGMELLPPETALDLMGALAESGVGQTTVIAARWDAMSRLLGGRRRPLLEDLLVYGDEESGVDSALRQRLAAADPAERRAELESIVRVELARVMSVEPEQIDVEQPLSALGLDSLMALELKNNLEVKLAFTLPMAKLLEGPSVIGLAEAASDVLGGGAQHDGEWRPLVTLRDATGDAAAAEPLFFLPALGGDVLCYSELLEQLGTDRPLLAFRPRGLDDGALPHDVREALITDYVAAIRDRQPIGPYRLAGWSTGGVTAFAVAERLESIGEEVAAVALFDSPLPTIYDAIDPDDEVRFLASIVDFAARFSGLDFQMSVDELYALPEAERFTAALDRAKRAGLFPADVDEAYVRRLVAVGEALVRASRGYDPRPLKATVHFFSPTEEGALEELAPTSRDNADGWAGRIGQPLTRHEAPGDHFTMMTGDGAAAIARALDGVL